MGDFFDNSQILTIIKNRKRHLIILSGIGLLVSVFISSPWIMKPKFKSTAIVYPSNLSSYGEESPTEQLLQLFASEEINKEMIRKFNLGTHYDLDSTEKYYQTNLHKTFTENVSVEKTEYEAVEVSVIDHTPDTAYAMTQEMINLLNKTVREMHRKKYNEILVIAEKQYELKKKEIDSLEAVVQELRTKYNILDYGIQVKEATRKYYRSTGADSKLADATNMLRNLEAKGEDYIESTYLLNAARSAAVILKNDVEMARKEIRKELSFVDVVTSPKVPDKKFWPVRWVIVSTFTVSTFFGALIFFLFADHKQKKVVIKDIQKEEVPVLS